MKREWRSGRGVSARDVRSDRPRTCRGEHTPGIIRMTAVDMRGCVDELADGTGGSVDAVTGAAIGPYRKSRMIGRYDARPDASAIAAAVRGSGDRVVRRSSRRRSI